MRTAHARPCSLENKSQNVSPRKLSSVFKKFMKCVRSRVGNTIRFCAIIKRTCVSNNIIPEPPPAATSTIKTPWLFSQHYGMHMPFAYYIAVSASVSLSSNGESDETSLLLATSIITIVYVRDTHAFLLFTHR